VQGDHYVFTWVWKPGCTSVQHRGRKPVATWASILGNVRFVIFSDVFLGFPGVLRQDLYEALPLGVRSYNAVYCRQSFMSKFLPFFLVIFLQALTSVIF
jgi:hypothetical protein